jgi:hypothetical protein
MTIESNLQQRIAREPRSVARQAASSVELPGWIESGNVQAAVEKLFFFSSPAEFANEIKRITQTAETRFGSAAGNVRLCYLRFLTDVYLGLSSSLARWNLRNAARHAERGGGLAEVDLKRAANQVREAAEELGRAAAAETPLLLAQWLDDVDQTAAWTPVNNTLSQFCKSYDSFLTGHLHLRLPQVQVCFAMVQRVQVRRAQGKSRGACSFSVWRSIQR